MSAFYDLSSLVVVPSGYKSGKVYAQKPLTTDGQLTFTRASTATRVNASGLIETVSSGVPRLDYLDSTCPKLLLEPSRTNAALYSSDFSNAAWVLDGDGAGQSVTANYAISPDGSQNADRIQLSKTGGSYSRIRQNFTAAYSGATTFSIYLKTNDASTKTAYLRIDGGTSTLITITGNWTRFSVTNNWIYSLGYAAELFLDTGSSNTADVSAYGAQVEQGAYVSSLIPTTTAAVTRVADACSKTGISSLIGQTEGTLFLDITLGSNPVTLRLFSVASPTWADNSIRIDWNAIVSDSRIVCEGVYAGARTFILNSINPYTNGSRLKIAIAYKANDCVMYINGVQQSTDTTTGTIPACSVVALNELYGFASGSFEKNDFNQTLLFKTRLTNAQLAELTAL